MEYNEILVEATSALGVESPTPLTQGGQKTVLSGDISGTLVVVKIVLIPDGAYAPIAVTRARREVELLTSIESVHVVKMMSEAIEIGDRPHAVCWAEEYLDGQDVGGLLGEKWNDADTVRMLHDIALGLKACHDLDVVHRDISPGNVRCCTDGRFVLMDPGFARHLAKTALTGEFQPGTPGFRSPEHVPGGEPTPASDIFGLGVLAFLARSSILPVDYNGDDDDYYRRLTEMQSPSLRSMCPDASNALVGIVDRCLQRQPARRYLDGSELLTGVESALSSGTDG